MPSSRLFRFGGFTFDPVSGDLESADKVARLQPQVAALLLALIEHAGDVVSRGELQERLWPATTVEFDEGINFCVRQLRVALNDDAGAPRFIETLPKRGYRFLVPVTIDATHDDEVASTGTVAQDARPRRSHPIARILLGVAALVLVAGLTALARGHLLPGQIRGHEAIVLVILPFAADTTDPMMMAYRQRLTDQILADARAEQGWRAVTEASLGATHVLSGSLTRHGNSVQIFVQLLLARDRQHLWAEDILDGYAFSGNSTITADKIEQSAARVLGASH
jgi:DNA-binding winged helix-turn-helix (wHTH) protein/TolB-like protein